MPDDCNQDRKVCANCLLGERMKNFINRLWDVSLYFVLVVFVVNLIRGAV
jgi:hypothetical protein